MTASQKNCGVSWGFDPVEGSEQSKVGTGSALLGASPGCPGILSFLQTELGVHAGCMCVVLENLSVKIGYSLW